MKLKEFLSPKPDETEVYRAKRKKQEIDMGTFKSPKDIEDYYKEEKQKVNKFLLDIERERAKGYLTIAEKNLLQVKLKKKEIEDLLTDLKAHIQKLKAKQKELKAKRKQGTGALGHMKVMKMEIAKLVLQAKDIEKIRKDVLDRENKYVGDMKKIAAENKPHIGVIDPDDAQKLVDVQESKEMLVKEAHRLLGEEAARMFPEKELMDKLTGNAMKAIQRLNSEIRNLDMKIKQLMQHKQLLLISDERAKDDISKLEKKRVELQKKYAQVLKMKRPGIGKKPAKKKAKRKASKKKPARRKKKR